MPQDGGKVPIEVIVGRLGDNSGGETVENSRYQVVFGLYGVKIDRSEASPPHTDVLRSENRENFIGIRVNQQSFSKKLPRYVQNALAGEPYPPGLV
jgi:hypothetical protein